ncbi:MAG: arylesterase [Gemmatimonadaceae bacterium]
MRIEKKGNRRIISVVRVSHAPLLILVSLALVACSKGNDAPTDSRALPKSTLGDTSAATGQSATAPSGGKKARVVILGTSLTAGLGLDPSEAYPALLQQLADSAKFNVNIVAAGLSGETSAGALRRASWVLDQPADAVVLEVGANDGLRGVNPDSTQANIEAVVDLIHKKYASARVVLVQMEAPPNFGRDYTTRFHNAYSGVSRSRTIELLPFLLDSVAGIASLNQGDGIHPNKTGSHIVARNMLRALTPLFTTLSADTKTSTP